MKMTQDIIKTEVEMRWPTIINHHSTLQQLAYRNAFTAGANFGMEMDRWVRVEDGLPEITKDKTVKWVWASNGNRTYGAVYFPDMFKTIEFEDWDDYDEGEMPWTINDREKGCVWLKQGWYIEEYDRHDDYYLFVPTSVTHWQPLPSPPQI